jgi:DNA-directed RNA polymerase specialized sigma24 family protein
MDVQDIASEMGITEGSVKVHLFRAVHSVRKRCRAGHRFSSSSQLRTILN